MAKKKTEETNTGFQLYNKKAKFNFELIEFLEVGIKLVGSEVKVLREKKGNLTDAFCQIKGQELFLNGLQIPLYKNGGYANHSEYRPRKLLAHKKQILKWERTVKEKGLAIIATKCFFNDKNMVKVEIALGKPKKLYDKREDMKEKDSKQEINRALKASLRQ